MEPVSMLNNETFAKNLLLTQAYCEIQLANSDRHASEILRSINLEYDGKPMFRFLDGPYTYLEYNTDPLDLGLYDRFFDLQLEYKRNLLKGIQRTTTANGKILMIDIYEALPDGASEAYTEGFIDGNDCPPIDTWFYIGQGKNCPILYAWIPEPFVATVDQGIAVNALEIFDWMENPTGTINIGRFAVNNNIRETAQKRMPGVDQEIFNRNLVLTQVYCEMQLANTEKSPAEILRSFNPIYNGNPMFSFVASQYSPPFYTSADWSLDPLESENKDLYNRLFKQQMDNKISSGLISVGNFEGKILVTEIDTVIWDGAAEQESNGFIDINDCTPIDTWFYMEEYKGNRILYSWIPAQYVALVESATEVNMLGTFCWIEDFTYTDYAYLKDAANSAPYQTPRWYDSINKSVRLDLLVLSTTLISIILWLFFGK
nr:hypothetical protein [uncultured Mucilaginibacter sp.]